MGFLWKQQEKLRQSILTRRDADLTVVAGALERFGITDATPETAAKVFDYLFDSAGLAFYYPNYQAWMRLATGRGTIANLQATMGPMAGWDPEREDEARREQIRQDARASVQQIFRGKDEQRT